MEQIYLKKTHCDNLLYLNHDVKGIDRQKH